MPSVIKSEKIKPAVRIITIHTISICGYTILSGETIIWYEREEADLQYYSLPKRTKA